MPTKKKEFLELPKIITTESVGRDNLPTHTTDHESFEYVAKEFTTLAKQNSHESLKYKKDLISTPEIYPSQITVQQQSQNFQIQTRECNVLKDKKKSRVEELVGDLESSIEQLNEEIKSKNFQNTRGASLSSERDSLDNYYSPPRAKG